MRFSVVALALGAWAVVACSQPSQDQAVAEVAVADTLSQDALIERGEYLVNAIGCDDCHSPKVFTEQGPELDPARRFAGQPAEEPIAPVSKDAKAAWVLFNHHNTAVAGPWGVSFAANISSDETGIGNWTEEQFFRAMREGRSKGIATNRMMLPPMPWPNYAKLSDQDLKAIFAYLKSTPPVRNVVPAPLTPDQI